jgi:DNA-binding transcriptional MerR regulator
VLTVEELADRTGESVRTIRFYQSEGVLPPPVRHGREARYDAAHVERLRVINELQQRGLRLNAIKDLLAHSPDWLNLGESLAQPWTEDHPVVLDEAALAEKVHGLPDDTIDGLIDNGVIERRGDTSPVVFFVPSPGMLDVSLTAVRVGLDAGAGALLRDMLQRRMRETADELVAQFTKLVSIDRLADSGPAELARLLDQLRPLTRRTVDLLFSHEMERAQRELLDAAAEAAEAPAEIHAAVLDALERPKQ